MDEKLDSVQLEYTYLLTSQLESQRSYYEDEISRLKAESKLGVRRVFNLISWLSRNSCINISCVPF